MTTITVDAATAAKLAALNEVVQLCDEAGNVLGWYDPGRQGDERRPTLRRLIETCPLPDEQLDEISKRGDGKLLTEVLGDLGTS